MAPFAASLRSSLPLTESPLAAAAVRPLLAAALAHRVTRGPSAKGRGATASLIDGFTGFRGL